MKIYVTVLISLLVLTTFGLAACGPSENNEGEPTPPPIPTQYANLKNPLSGQADVIAAGKAIFDTNCAPCHGPKGLGDGPAGVALDPRPADLTDPAQNDPDGVIFYHISEGAKAGDFPDESQMAAWQGKLTTDQIWQVISYIRTLPAK
jgi:mono/diheme cytochrome c family protein